MHCVSAKCFLEEGARGVALCLRHVPLTNGQEKSYEMASKSFISLKSVREANNRNKSERQPAMPQSS